MNMMNLNLCWSDPVLYVSKQNLCFILPQFLYQFFCGYSQQVSAALLLVALFFRDAVIIKEAGSLITTPAESFPLVTPPYLYCPTVSECRATLASNRKTCRTLPVM